MEKTPSKPSAEEPPARVPPPPPAAAPTKPKRKSSWEALASMFNVSVEREPEPVEPDPVQVEPVEEKRSEPPRREAAESAPPQAATRKDLAIFEEPATDANEALDVMFGDAPREKLSSQGSGWGKPKRVVDDLGWDEVEVEPRGKAVDEPRLSTESLEDNDDESGDDAGGEEGAARRGRRRRRRGRRGRGRDEESAATTEDSPEVDEPVSREAPVSWKHETLEVESAGAWAEPDSFESDLFDAGDEQLDDEQLDEDSGDEDSGDDSEVLRRSSRRRRRRGRGREDSPRAEAPADEARRGSGVRDSAAPRSVRAREERPRREESSVERPRRGTPRPPEKVAPRVEIEDDFLEIVDDEIASPADEDRTASESRGAGGRRRRGRKPVDSPARAATDDVGSPDEELDELDELSDEEASAVAQKHRNIPTWSDSLESIIQANTENHKRNEGRGGSRGGGGGRSRGRR